MNLPEGIHDHKDDSKDKKTFSHPNKINTSTSDLNQIDDAEEAPRERERPYCLPYLQSVLFASMIEDCITQLRLLAECNNELRIIKTMTDMAKLRAKKYQIKQEDAQHELSGIDHKNLGCMQYKLDKLAADRGYCTEVLMGTYVELSINRCFGCLTDSNKEILNRDMYRFNLAEEEARNRLSRRELLRQLRQQRNHIKSVAYDTDLIVEKLKCRVEDAALIAETRDRYIVNWERARTEQHAQCIHDKEVGPSDAIKYYRQRADYEHRVHSEVELLVNIFINETLAKVETWMTKYDTDMEDVDLKIQIQKMKYQDELAKRVELENTIATHKMLMDNWIQFKKTREENRQYHEKMTNSAIIVQAWWRGLLVRLELGPYKPQRRPPPKPAAGKKKK